MSTSINYRIKTPTMLLLYGVAIFFDAVQLFVLFFHIIPAFGNLFALVVGWSIFFFGFLFLSLMFLFLKTPPHIVALLLTFTAGMTPFVHNLVPELTLLTWRVIRRSRREDRRRAGTKAVPSGGVARSLQKVLMPSFK